ncbi:AAA family ATPase [Acetobacter sp. LMG 32666]|uniref:AAA family ATPase n=1 Tax=Acetobacter sp. LMG 32666 TaxID=2959295 RepID=UPI0030C82B2C
MTVRFVRLRIVGFKSFADPITVELLPGLTGVVGPNGCGKSNVVEALRWVMGESSARSLRGGEMDDLIFAGTTGRPARSLAEVTVTLEGTRGFGPAAFADLDELQITRRAERGAGSEYRINGRTVRARDVQTLFADLASGARSSAMVSQGRVAMLVGARPEERRSILEEAAGITGLHARRHEAEIKLRATEGNLTRAEDRRVQLTERLSGLAEQSREATRYREISAALREAETELLAVLHARARLAVERAATMAAQARKNLSTHEETAETAVLAEFEATKALPALREKADAARTALERCRVLAEGVVREEERAAAQAQAAAELLLQHEADAQAAQTRLQDVLDTLERLQTEKAEAQAAQTSLPTRTADAEQQLQHLSAQQSETEQALVSLTADLNAARAGKERAEDGLTSARARHDRVCLALSTLQAELAELESQLPSEQALSTAQERAEQANLAQLAAKAAQDEAERLCAQCNVDLSIAKNNAQAAQAAQTEQQKALQQARQRLTSLQTELHAAEKRHAEALEALVSPDVLNTLQTNSQHATTALDLATQAQEQAEAERRAASTAFTEASRAAQEAEAHQRSAAEALRTARTTQQRAQHEAQTLARELDKIRAEAIADTVLAEARQARTQHENALAQTGADMEQAEHTLSEQKAQHTTACEQQASLQTELTRLQAQAEGLDQALGQDSAVAENPVSTQITVPEEYENALAAALAEGLDAPTAGDAPQGWRQLPPESLPALPGGAQPLKACISAPPELDRVLLSTGLLPHGADGHVLQQALAPGQCLVSTTGDLWRWDGFYARAGGTSTAARRLAQRRILRETQLRLATLQADLPAIQASVATCATAVRTSEDTLKDLRNRRHVQEQSLQKARAHETETERRHASYRARLDAMLPQHERAQAALEEAETTLTQAQSTHESLPSLQDIQSALATTRNTNTAAQAAEQQAHTAFKQAQATLQAARDKLAQTEQQHASATTRLETLTPELERLRHNLATEATTVTELEARLASAQSVQHAQAALRDAQDKLNTANAALQEATQATLRADELAAATAQTNRHLQEQALTLRSRLAGLTPRQAELQTEHTDAAQLLHTAQATLEAALAAIPEDAEARLEQLNTQRADLLTRLDSARELRAALQAESSTLADRLAALETAQAEWATRESLARTDNTNALQRLESARANHSRVAELPTAAQQQKASTLAALEDAEDHFTQTDRLRAEAEAALSAAHEQRRKTEGELATARENLLKAEGKSEQAQAILDQLLVETPNPPRQPVSDLTEGAETSLRRKIARLTRERDDMGPVNLRAELEAEEASTQAQTLGAEMSDLEEAINRLRGSIGSLNKEGRERLMAVFTQVDQHFQSLFTRMFGGGRAHLGLVGSDDPLEAGLEIYAQPPGKKLATLSLLSGGEQALTALSLIFAVFRCNPAPICVLDEVDAPLDDANVGRFSALLGDMVVEAGTRFLVVTHHQLTMAHMDQLFGVTMQERGVSRVLSVDLAKAASMVGQKDKEPTDVTS